MKRPADGVRNGNPHRVGGGHRALLTQCLLCNSTNIRPIHFPVHLRRGRKPALFRDSRVNANGARQITASPHYERNSVAVKRGTCNAVYAGRDIVDLQQTTQSLPEARVSSLRQ